MHQAGPGGRLHGVSVLFVDDDAHVVESIGSYLRFSGAHVETALSGDEALQRLAAARVQAVVLDYSMPGMTGIELLSYIRKLPGEAERPTPAILYTALPHLRDAALTAGFSAYLIKPLNPRVLVDEIARLVGI